MYGCKHTTLATLIKDCIAVFIEECATYDTSVLIFIGDLLTWALRSNCYTKGDGLMLRVFFSEFLTYYT